MSVRLSREHAIVLFEWLARTDEIGRPAAFMDQAEQRVFWDLGSDLEVALPEILAEDYPGRLAAAREAVRDRA